MGDIAQEDEMFQEVLNKIQALLGGKPLSDAELVTKLEKKAEGTGLNWKTSVVDFLKLLGVDSSLNNRDALAAELGISTELKSGSAAKNEALRKAIFKKIAENGGNLPKYLMN